MRNPLLTPKTLSLVISGTPTTAGTSTVTLRGCDFFVFPQKAMLKITSLDAKKSLFCNLVTSSERDEGQWDRQRHSDGDDQRRDQWGNDLLHDERDDADDILDTVHGGALGECDGDG
jgi:hypothetical protein